MEGITVWRSRSTEGELPAGTTAVGQLRRILEENTPETYSTAVAHARLEFGADAAHARTYATLVCERGGRPAALPEAVTRVLDHSYDCVGKDHPLN